MSLVTKYQRLHVQNIPFWRKCQVCQFSFSLSGYVVPSKKNSCECSSTLSCATVRTELKSAWIITITECLFSNDNSYMKKEMLYFLTVNSELLVLLVLEGQRLNEMWIYTCMTVTVEDCRSWSYWVSLVRGGSVIF